MKYQTSLRNVHVGWPEAREALKNFFEKFRVCPRCKGHGLIVSKKMPEDVHGYPLKFDYSKIEGAIEMRECVQEGFGDLMREAIYREMKLKKTCPKCNGVKFVKK